MLIRVRQQRMAMGDPGFGGFGKWFGKAVSRTIHGKAFRSAIGPIVSMIPGVGAVAGTVLGGLLGGGAGAVAGGAAGMALGGAEASAIRGSGLMGPLPGGLGASAGSRGGAGRHRKMTPEERKARGLKPHLSMSWSNSRALARSQRRLGMFIHHFTRTARFLGMHVGRAPHRSKRGAFPRRKR